MTIQIKCFRQVYLDRFRANIRGNISKYSQGQTWMAEEFPLEPWDIETSFTLPADFELVMPDVDGHHDLENSIRLHTALRHLNLSQATDERLWAHLSHGQFWAYMRARWPVENYISGTATTPEVAVNLRQRYFYMANRDRALVRNGIARLWWYGHVSYDPSRANPYELTPFLLDKLDIAQSLLERSISRNQTLVKAVLTLLSTEEVDGSSVSNRARFRTLMQHLNMVGGVTVLDALSKDDVIVELRNRIAIMDVA